MISPNFFAEMAASCSGATSTNPFLTSASCMWLKPQSNQSLISPCQVIYKNPYRSKKVQRSHTCMVHHSNHAWIADGLEYGDGAQSVSGTTARVSDHHNLDGAIHAEDLIWIQARIRATDQDDAGPSCGNCPRRELNSWRLMVCLCKLAATLSATA